MRSAAPMEARAAAELPAGPGWWFEPKWDGFRCLAFRDGDEVILQAKSGKPLTRFFPEVAARLRGAGRRRVRARRRAADRRGGRLLVRGLQMRLHPAESRIRKLAASHPASLALFDMLEDVGRPRPACRAAVAPPWGARRFPRPPCRSAADGDAAARTTAALAQSWLDGGALEGVVAKRLDAPYLEGERAMVKVKRVRTADCVVGGFRYAQGSSQVGSLLLGLYDDAGRLDHVGFTSGFAGVDRAALTTRLEALRGGPGFTGDAPGGPSRWSDERSAAWTPVRPELVVEVSFDHVSAGRFRHGTRLLRLRPDKAPAQCRMDQIAATRPGSEKG